MRAIGTYIFRGVRIRTRTRGRPRHRPQMHKPHFLLVPPFPGVFVRRSAAYWVLLHLMRAVIVLFMPRLDELRPVDLLPGGNPLVPALVVALGMLQARRSDEDLYRRTWATAGRSSPRTC